MSAATAPRATSGDDQHHTMAVPVDDEADVLARGIGLSAGRG